MNKLGKKNWYIADAYFPDNGKGGVYTSHEAVCVLNATKKDAVINITLLFEDREPMEGFCIECKSMRTNHIRMDRLTDSADKPVPQGVAYAMLIKSNTKIVCQYSRVDTAQTNMSFMTTMAY